MSEEEIIKAALIAIEKKCSYDEFYYSDYMYGHEEQTEDVFVYVRECEEMGTIDFEEKYKKELGE